MEAVPLHLNLKSALFVTSLVAALTVSSLVTMTGEARADRYGTLSAATEGQAVNPARNVTTKTIKLGAAETLDMLLAREGINDVQREAAINALADLVDLRKLQANDDIDISLRGDDGEEPVLVALHIHGVNLPDTTIVANAYGEFLRPTEFARSWSTSVMTRAGNISRDFESDLLHAEVPATVVQDVIAAFAYDSSLPKDLPKGSRFSVVYEGAVTGDPKTEASMLRYAEINVRGKPHRVYRYQMPDGQVTYVDKDGQGVIPLDLQKPITDNARMTSGFGWRTHPVLKVRKFHNGVDWAAPKGTPVYASEDGTIEQIAWRGNYGRYIKLQHTSRVATTYAHLSRFADGLHKGSAVRKGQVIGYVGASGLATGNHLYYEVLVDNKHIDPLKPMSIAVTLDEERLAQFRQFAAQTTAPMKLAPLNP